MCGANSAEGGTQERSDGAVTRERDYRGNTWRDAIGEEGGRIDVMDTFKGRLMWKGGKRVAGDIWMMRKQEAT
jgi:hypothetical protein